MARPQIVDVDYYQFQKVLRKAIDTGDRIDRADKERWAKWVRENNIREGAFGAFAKVKYDGLEPVIIDNDTEWRGYYLFSADDQAVLKWVRET